MMSVGMGMRAQEVLADEMLQARVHFMNDAKVSYISEDNAPQESYLTPSTDEIPSNIQASFQAKYREAVNVHWVIKEDRYKIRFEQGGEEMFAYYDRRGHWIKSFTKLTQKELPKAISQYLDSQYNSHELAKFYLKDTPNGTFYLLAVKKDQKYIWLEFDLEGNVQISQV